MKRIDQRPRQGSILPLLAASMVGVFGLVALAVDIGMIAAGKSQLQNAADAAAMTGARSLDGSVTSNLSGASMNAANVAATNRVLAKVVKTGEVSTRHGAYHYDTATETYAPNFPPVAPDNYNLTEATITLERNTGFARIFGVPTVNLTAVAMAAHRPRDISIILDFSGSMNNESDLWNNETYLGSASNSPNNTDSVFPKFGHYSDITNAKMQCTSSDSRVGKCNITQSVLGIPPLVNDFYQHNRGSSASSAFNAESSAYQTSPGGDNYKGINGDTGTPPGTYAKTVQEVTGSTSAQITGKTDAPMPSYNGFQGYTMGPKYYGKTFYLWPPDPDYVATGNPASGVNPHTSFPGTLTDAPRDWRRRFFLKTGGSHPNFGGQMDDNTKLWDASGNWRNPSGFYVINYRAILHWLKNTGSNPFPSQLRAGRILYYDAIPDDVPTAAYDPTQNNYAISWGSQNERFWKEYIDYVIGVWKDPAGGIQNPGNPSCSYGPDWTWGTIRITAPVDYTLAPAPNNIGSLAKTAGFRMHPQDNPKRPRHRFWFGPMTMIQYISDCGLLPGTAHDISMYPAKLGISGALEDIRNNHPNDMVSLILFNRPHFTGEAAERGRFSQAQYALSRDYTGMQNALWFPPNSSSADVRPWSSDGFQTPRSGADYQGNTTSNYGFMLAYNQFSENSGLQSSGTGGFGRKGAQRLVIFETDGMANVAANAGFSSNGKYSYYQIGSTDTVTSGGAADAACYSIVDRLVALETDTTTGPGFAKPGRPVLIHCIAFGAVFEPSASGTEAANASTLLRTISTKGGTYFPTSSTDTSNGDQSYKICIGTLDERRQKLEKAFRKVTENVTTPALIQ